MDLVEANISGPGFSIMDPTEPCRRGNLLQDPDPFVETGNEIRIICPGSHSTLSPFIRKVSRSWFVYLNRIQNCSKIYQRIQIGRKAQNQILIPWSQFGTLFKSDKIYIKRIRLEYYFWIQIRALKPDLKKNQYKGFVRRKDSPGQEPGINSTVL